MKDFAVSLKKARMKEGLTQKEFASELGISINTYVTWEARGTNRRTPSFENMKRIARILRITLDELAGE